MSALRLVKLSRRKLLKIYGPDCYSYLQGLLCNDVRYLYQPELLPTRKNAFSSINSMTTFMLNAQGRAICDMILYRTPQTRSEAIFSPPGKESIPDELLIECDSDLASGLANTLYGYRVRRKIAVTIREDLSCWCLYPELTSTELNEDGTELMSSSSLAQLSSNEMVQNDFTIVCDPRLHSMGMRVITNASEEFTSLSARLCSLIGSNITSASQTEYRIHRYTLGLGEGKTDHPESDCLPLECNADYLGAVSFNKGCYLGQELTARIHHTGVVRKRLMPIMLEQEPGREELGALPPIPGSDIVNEANKKIGVLRAVTKDRGLALLRHELALSSEKLSHEGSKMRIYTYRPSWWAHDRNRTGQVK